MHAFAVNQVAAQKFGLRDNLLAVVLLKSLLLAQTVSWSHEHARELANKVH